MKRKISLLLILPFCLLTNLLSQNNIQSDRIYWKESTYPNYGICGVFNPEKKTIEWKESTYPHYGICGVFNQ